MTNIVERLHNAPETIWLQVDPDGADPTEEFLPDGATWCQDKINDSDVEYVRADVVESLRQQLAGATKALNSAKLNIASTDKVREFEAIKYRQADEAISTLASEREANAILTQQLAESQLKADANARGFSDASHKLAECQAREKVLRDALADGISGATKEDIKQAKREVLLEVADWFEQDSNEWISRVATGAKLRKKAKELE